jgi:hypothetical protein
MSNSHDAQCVERDMYQEGLRRLELSRYSEQPSDPQVMVDVLDVLKVVLRASLARCNREIESVRTWQQVMVGVLVQVVAYLAVGVVGGMVGAAVALAKKQLGT